MRLYRSPHNSTWYCVAFADEFQRNTISVLGCQLDPLPGAASVGASGRVGGGGGGVVPLAMRF
jgi:hypothetical protein